MNEVFRFDSFSLDVMARTLRKEGHEVSIGSRAFDILAALVEGEGKVLTRRELMACAWPGLVVEESNVRVQVAHLRKALGCGEDGVRFIVSVAGRGYCFAARVRRERVPQPVPSRRLAPSATARVESGEGRPLANAAVAWERIIGREESVAELTALLSQRRLVTIVGAAGMGKTTVAVQAARSLSRVGNPVHFADLSLVTRGDQVLDALSSAAGYRPSGSVKPTGLAEFLDAHSTLVVLDNCEHVIADAALLCRQILDTTRQVSILCTSREALRVLEELVYLLPSLASPPNTGKLTAEQAVAWPSVQLFVNRAEECGALDVLSDESASMLAAICRRLDGNPLAIELVASRVGTYGVQGVSELLATQAGLHWQGRRDATPRHRTVEALLDWTYDLLPEGHRLALCRLSVFSGGFALESAVDVISDDRLDTVQAATAIADLADKSLICARSMDGRMRLRLLETTRAYAAEKLAALDGHDTAHRHALYYADYLRSRDAASTPDPGAPPDVREDELGNVRVALDWAFSNAHDAVLAVELSALAAPSFLQHRSFDECMRCCVRALARMPVELQSTHTELVLREAMAIAYASMGLYGDDMVFVLQRGLEISQSLADHRATFHLYAGLHLTMLGLGRFQESMRVAQQYAGLASSTGKASEAVIASWMIGASHHFIGEHSTAEAQFATARRMLAHASLRRLQYFDIKARLNASLGMARTKLSMGLPEQALQLSINTI
ncbi:helix-turn-helix transcriptional regulator [Lysobacter sp. MMG2]|uniref:ATP-binding protein n=1 Tax=Lysobacter sp. MMG2 TaxID=2801338 RepID=UPI001C227E45|nr:winged helix-turn-helix domain-containing protein [Lysobacter sp. MMG2]MBU8977797.1 helix-turn-helix transcriptional regulator [Lysobacter sp. MMG2]